MNRREWIIFLLLLLPSLANAWWNRDMPQFGWGLHDDGLYFTSAKAWAQSNAHKIISLPGEPWQTKYPPVFPVLLSAVWIVAPEFPKNLHLATLLAWCFVPAILLLFRALLRQYGFPPVWAWLVLAVFACNPYLGYFGRSLLSETPYTALLLAVFLLQPRSSVAAGCLAGLAYLTRTSALPLLVALPAYYLWRGERRNAVWFAAGMLPFIVGWTVWISPRKLRLDDPHIMYYVDYLWYQFFSIHLSNVTLFLGTNLDRILTAMAAPVFPLVTNTFDKMVALTIAVGSIAGVYRLTKERHQCMPYTLYALGHLFMLLVWHFPSDGRLVSPIFPLLLAGLSVEIGRIGAVAVNASRAGSQRSGVIVFATMMGVFLLMVLHNNYDLFSRIPASAAHDRTMTRDTLACAKRADREMAAGESIMADNDALVYHVTGRHAMRMISPVVRWYEGRFLEAELQLPDVAREHGFNYLMVNRDFHPGLTPEENAIRIATFAKHSDLQAIFSCGTATVYKVIAPRASRGTD